MKNRETGVMNAHVPIDRLQELSTFCHSCFILPHFLLEYFKANHRKVLALNTSVCPPKTHPACLISSNSQSIIKFPLHIALLQSACFNRDLHRLTDCIWLTRPLVSFNDLSPPFPRFFLRHPCFDLASLRTRPFLLGASSVGARSTLAAPPRALWGSPLGPPLPLLSQSRRACEWHGFLQPCGRRLYSYRCEVVLPVSRYPGWPLVVSGLLSLSPVEPQSPGSDENG